MTNINCLVQWKTLPPHSTNKQFSFDIDLQAQPDDLTRKQTGGHIRSQMEINI